MIDPEEVCLPDLSPVIALEALALLCPVGLQRPETCDIQALQSMSTVRWVRYDDDIVISSKVEELDGAVRVVAINEEDACLAALLQGLFMKVADVFNSNCFIGVALRGGGVSASPRSAQYQGQF